MGLRDGKVECIKYPVQDGTYNQNRVLPVEQCISTFPVWHYLYRHRIMICLPTLTGKTCAIKSLLPMPQFGGITQRTIKIAMAGSLSPSIYNGH